MTRERLMEIIAKCRLSTNVKYVADWARRIVAEKNPHAICDFAEYVPLADTPEVMPILEDGMLEIGDFNHAYEMMYCMTTAKKKNFNLPKFEDVLLQSEDDTLIGFALEFVKGINKRKIKISPTPRIPKVLKNLSREQVLWLEGFLKKEPAGISAYAMARFAQYNENANRRAMQKSVLNGEDWLNIYEWGCSAPGADKVAVAKRLSQSEDPKIMCYFVEFGDSGCEEKLTASIENTGSKKYTEIAKAHLAKMAKQKAEDLAGAQGK